jgi:hypothetical protein
MELKLNADEVTQLYVLMSLFHQTGELRKLDYGANGPARTLAGKIADFFGSYYGEATIEKTPAQ